MKCFILILHTLWIYSIAVCVLLLVGPMVDHGWKYSVSSVQGSRWQSKRTSLLPQMVNRMSLVKTCVFRCLIWWELAGEKLPLKCFPAESLLFCLIRCNTLKNHPAANLLRFSIKRGGVRLLISLGCLITHTALQLINAAASSARDSSCLVFLVTIKLQKTPSSINCSLKAQKTLMRTVSSLKKR